MFVKWTSSWDKYSNLFLICNVEKLTYSQKLTYIALYLLQLV